MRSFKLASQDEDLQSLAGEGLEDYLNHPEP